MYNPVSRATVAPNGMSYTAGDTGRSPQTRPMLPTFDRQAHQALRILGDVLREAGGGSTDVMFVQLDLREADAPRAACLLGPDPVPANGHSPRS